ncbi:MAG TPA: hypothetical protein EYP85_14800 [Armatimonadetes bacterium]|nr:hypothetical protein [Armatimonadota bacterium]
MKALGVAYRAKYANENLRRFHRPIECAYAYKAYARYEEDERDANRDTLELYDPDLESVGGWEVSSLPCLEHGSIDEPVYDGLQASTPKAMP